MASQTTPPARRQSRPRPRTLPSAMSRLCCSFHHLPAWTLRLFNPRGGHQGTARWPWHRDGRPRRSAPTYWKGQDWIGPRQITGRAQPPGLDRPGSGQAFLAKGPVTAKRVTLIGPLSGMRSSGTATSAGRECCMQALFRVQPQSAIAVAGTCALGGRTSGPRPYDSTGLCSVAEENDRLLHLKATRHPGTTFFFSRLGFAQGGLQQVHAKSGQASGKASLPLARLEDLPDPGKSGCRSGRAPKRSAFPCPVKRRRPDQARSSGRRPAVLAPGGPVAPAARGRGDDPCDWRGGRTFAGPAP